MNSSRMRDIPGRKPSKVAVAALVVAMLLIGGAPLGAQQTNTEATGSPTISGTARVHETLTADAADIADADGMTGADLQYQWFANDGSRTPGTGDRFLGSFSGSEYVVQSRDEGYRIWVQVVFVDDGGTSEFVDSAPTAAVQAAADPKVPQAPDLVGVDPLPGGFLSVSWRMPQYPYGDGGSVLTGFKVQWRSLTRPGSGSATSWDTPADVSEKLLSATSGTGSHSFNSWIIPDLAPGTGYAVRVLATNAVGDGKPSAQDTATTEEPALSISGTLVKNYAENGTSSVGTYTVSGSDGTITWSLSGADGGDFTISGTGALGFTSPPDFETPADADADNVYKVTVNATDGTDSASLDVTIVVLDEDEPEPQVGGI